MKDNFFKRQQIFFTVVALTPVFILAIILYLQKDYPKSDTDYNDTYLYISVIFCTLAVIGSTMLYRLQMPAARSKETNDAKLIAWQSSFMLKIALIEGAAIINIVFL